jgi:capsular polysaccharide biosynthesis protein
VDFGRGPVEEPLDARRYVEALRRRVWLLIALPLVVAAIVLVIALALPKTYTAAAKIAPTTGSSSNSSSSGASSSSAPPDLATTQAYATSPPVLAAAARQLHGETAATLQSKVSASLDTKANIIDVTAKDGDANLAALLSNTVAQTFLSVRAASQRAQLVAQEGALTAKLHVARAQASAGLATALEQQISNLAAQEASAGSDLQLLASAPVPASASSPRPARDAAIAFVVALFLTMLVVGGKELMSPSVASDRELTGLIGAPVLARVPRVTKPPGEQGEIVDPAAAESYRFLAKSLELVDWRRRPRLVAITSADHEEGTTTVVSWLGAAVANSGASTLLISADLEEPAVPHGLRLRRSSAPGGEVRPVGVRPAKAGAMPLSQVAPNLSVLDTGALPRNASDGIVQGFFERIRELDFDYVLFDVAPLNRVAETQLFVRHADATLLACFVGRTTAEQLRQARELLDRVHVVPTGTVMLGVRRQRDGQSLSAAISWIRARMTVEDGSRAEPQATPPAARRAPRPPR